MTIKQSGGIFGRNPSFNTLDATTLTASGNITSSAGNLVIGTSGSTGSIALDWKIRIGGLPYTATSDTNGQDGQSALAVTSVQNFATNQPDSAIVLSGSDNIRLFSRSSSNGATSTMGFAELDTGANDNIIRLAGTYIAS